MTGTYLYTYGVTDDGSFEKDIPGVDDATTVYTVDYRRYSAIVSDIETMEPEQTDENARLHDDVLQALIEDRTVVPMRFGMTFKNGRALKGVLRGGQRAFRRALMNVDGKVELGVKLVTEEGVDVDRDAVREDVTERLGEVSDERAENDLFSDRLVVNDSYLVAHEDREAFNETMGDLTEAYEGELKVQYTGPWAPYNFVDIEIEAQ
ncbi:GvpL/GvpF family gas vesicle protein [Haloprofundus sp. MHR1]|uniref:GvpL/GvpF family gas vesicle protein n=1 Tax=Haloprofundus sp. MHR1 TaxID=2572921 RepID=UPI0010BE8C40|nr:GvpL/GvpF family gas vesicle protein [Haloprofundus sp. MHR1]QCJ47355.1 GvpL/GvpF family gas vesicle protein [Haloprofundus sp. MHR1]